ncbi:MAG: hypothetical protein U0599_04920 [Vicinamibacteria bacterium]
MKTMLGLRAGAPDPGSRVTAAEIGGPADVARRTAPAASRVRKKKPDGVHDRVALGLHGLAGAAAAPEAVAKASSGALPSASPCPPAHRRASRAASASAAYTLMAFGFLVPPAVARHALSAGRSTSRASSSAASYSVRRRDRRRQHAPPRDGRRRVAFWASILSMPYAMLSNASAAREDGLLAWGLQLLHRAAADRRLGRPRLRDGAPANDATRALLLGGISMPSRPRSLLRVRKEEASTMRCAPAAALALLLAAAAASAAPPTVTKVEPPSWWPGN